MRILVINPNTSEEMTDIIQNTVEKLCFKMHLSELKIDTITNSYGPSTIESHTDEIYSAYGVIDQINTKVEDYDAFVLACFSDPGLYAAREITSKPVVGIGEASMLLAMSLGWKFTLIGTMERDKANLMEQAERYGLEKRLASIRTLDLNVDSFNNSDNNSAISTEIKEVAEIVSKEDLAETICLACAGMSSYRDQIESELKIPVVDPVEAGLLLAITRCSLELNQPQIRFYEPTNVKKFVKTQVKLPRSYY